MDLIWYLLPVLRQANRTCPNPPLLITKHPQLIFFQILTELLHVLFHADSVNRDLRVGKKRVLCRIEIRLKLVQHLICFLYFI